MQRPTIPPGDPWTWSAVDTATAVGTGLVSALEVTRSHLERLDAVRPLLAIQADWSALPRTGRLLVETVTSREGFHLFVFPFAGRLINEGLATLVAARRFIAAKP